MINNDGSRVAGSSPEVISTRLVAAVNRRLAANKPVRRTLPGGGRVAVDRQLPFLVVYRMPVRASDEGTASFATSEAAYLVAPGQKKHQPGVTRLVQSIAETSGGPVRKHGGAGTGGDHAGARPAGDSGS